METRGALVKRRYRHSMCMFDDKMYVFGGEFAGENGHCYNDFHEFAFGTCWGSPAARGGWGAACLRCRCVLQTLAMT